MSIYFDNAATTPLFPEVIELLDKLNRESFANPSSIHSLGRKAKKQLEKSRADIAEILQAKTNEIFFCSSATEANNMIFNLLDYDLVITSPAEHASVIESAKATTKPIHWLELNQEGFIDLENLERILQEKSQDNKKILLSIMHGNNEIGTLQNIKAIAELSQKFSNVFFHSDCVQTFTKHEIILQDPCPDFISASAHKIHGPKGVGFLYIKNSIQEKYSHKFKTLIVGGGQESDMRSGTENINAIIAFALAAQINNQKERRERVNSLHEYFFKKLNTNDFICHGPKNLEQRVNGNLNFSLNNCKLRSEELVLQMDLKGFALSSGSACTSNKAEAAFAIESSYVLRACGIDESISSRAIRVSLSSFNNFADIDSFFLAIKELEAKFPLKQMIKSP